MGAVPPFAAMSRRAGRAVRDGMDSLWWPDHLVAFHSREVWATGELAGVQPDPHTYADPFTCIAACAEHTGTVLLGVCVTDAIRRSPATLAQTAMSLDHLAPGRVVLGLGAGEYANWAPYGQRVRSPTAVLEDAAARIRALLDDPGPDADGAVLGLRPAPGSAGPRLWLAAHGPRGLAATGRYADGWIPNFLTVEAWQAGRAAVARSAADAGRDPAAITYGLSAQVVAAPTHELAHQLLDHPVLRAFALLLPPERYAAVGAEHPLGSGGLHRMVASLDGAAQLEAARKVPFQVVHDYMLHGTSEEIVDKVEAYEGLDHVVCWDPVPLADLGAARDSADGVRQIASRLREGDV